MIPGLGLFYAGLTDRRNGLSLMLLCLLSCAIISLQWYFVGFSLAFSPTTSSSIIGDFGNAVFNQVGKAPHPLAPTIPASLFAFYQMMFAAITPALAIGATAGRLRIVPACIFILLWSTFAYDPIANWVWSPTGWLAKMHVLDYAGGSVVHVSSAMAAVGLVIVVGPRQLVREGKRHSPHNPSLVYIGTALLWFGWLGFNGGSALSANSRGSGANIASHLAACTGALVWCAVEWFGSKKVTAIGFCAGAVAGLACVTPGCGYITPSVALIYGTIAPLAAIATIRLFHHLGFDDSLDVFAVHGMGGVIGMILTGIFAQYSVTTVDAAPNTATAGWIDHVWSQVPVQLAAIACSGAWSLVITLLIGYGMNCIPGMSLRANADDELMGLDHAE
ncbi:hypothetical protein HK101_011929, partial [Irineochytrium annulatum]